MYWFLCPCRNAEIKYYRGVAHVIHTCSYIARSRYVDLQKDEGRFQSCKCIKLLSHVVMICITL